MTRTSATLTALAALAVTGLSALPQAARAQAATYAFTTFDPFGSTNTRAIGINDAGQVVGVYQDPASVNAYGYVTGAGGAGPVKLDPFGSTNTGAYGINDAGQVVGVYYDSASGHFYGYLATPNAAPEPSGVAAFAVAGMGLAALLLRARKRQAVCAP